MRRLWKSVIPAGLCLAAAAGACLPGEARARIPEPPVVLEEREETLPTGHPEPIPGGHAPVRRPPARRALALAMEVPEPDPIPSPEAGYEGPVLYAGGEAIPYAYALTCEATAYSCEGYTGITATGTVARVGAIAVDPDVIPYGTRMYIVSDDGVYTYGYATAEDCGGGIRGSRIDLYFDTEDECWEFGRRSCTVYILGEG